MVPLLLDLYELSMLEALFLDNTAGRFKLIETALCAVVVGGVVEVSIFVAVATVGGAAFTGGDSILESSSSDMGDVTWLGEYSMLADVG